MATTTQRGKAGWTPATGPLRQTSQAFLEESLAPLADNLPRRIDSCRDFIITQSVGGIQDNLGSDDVSIR